MLLPCPPLLGAATTATCDCQRPLHSAAPVFIGCTHAKLLLLIMQGLMPNYVKVVPSIAIAFVTYEQIKEMLGVEFRISE